MKMVYIYKRFTYKHILAWWDILLICIFFPRVYNFYWLQTLAQGRSLPGVENINKDINCTISTSLPFYYSGWQFANTCKIWHQNFTPNFLEPMLFPFVLIFSPLSSHRYEKISPLLPPPFLKSSLLFLQCRSKQWPHSWLYKTDNILVETGWNWIKFPLSSPCIKSTKKCIGVFPHTSGRK